jgi:hypothetical protein
VAVSFFQDLPLFLYATDIATVLSIRSFECTLVCLILAQKVGVMFPNRTSAQYEISDSFSLMWSVYSSFVHLP